LVNENLKGGRTGNISMAAATDPENKCVYTNINGTQCKSKGKLN